MEHRKKREQTLKSVGRTIKKGRTAKNISQTELAHYLGITKSSVSKYEHGEIEIPVSTLPLISEYCAFPIKDYVETKTIYDLADTYYKASGMVRETEDKHDEEPMVDMIAYLEKEENASSRDILEQGKLLAECMNEKKIPTDYICTTLGMIEVSIEPTYLSKEQQKKRLLKYIELMKNMENRLKDK